MQNVFNTFYKTTIFQVAVLIVYLLAFVLLVFYAIGTVFSPSSLVTSGDLSFLISISLLFTAPWVISSTLHGSERLKVWRTSILKGVQGLIAFSSVFCAALWYLYPQIERLEPLTLLLGFTAAWIAYVDRNKRTGTVSPLKDKGSIG